MKRAKKVLLLALCAVLLVAGSVAGTLAYLTSQAIVENTFTVGHVAITLDEKDVDKDTNAEDNVGEGENVRDKANAYHLVPGTTYTKDPIVHVQANSEDSWVFIKVENGLAGYEVEGEQSIAHQIVAVNEWTALNGEDGVYYKSYTKTSTVVDLPVFATFTIASTNEQNTNWNEIGNKTIKVTAYAIQKENNTGIFSVEDAWEILNP